MVYRRRARKSMRKPKRRQFRGYRRRNISYSSQLFSETFKCNTISAPSPTNTGVLSDGTIRIQPGTQFTAGKFMVRMTDVPQIQN